MYPLPHPERIDGRGMGVIYAPEDSNSTPSRREVRVSKELAWRLHIECSPIILNGTMVRDIGVETHARLPHRLAQSSSTTVLKA